MTGVAQIGTTAAMLALLASLVWSACTNGPGKVERIEGQTPDGRPFELVLRTGHLKVLLGEYRRVREFWGLDGGWPVPARDAFVLGIALSIDGRRIEFPARAYADLIDLHPQGLHWERSGGASLLSLCGSDAGGSYEVRFTIRDDRIVQREIWPGAFPAFEHEVTVFLR